MITQINWKLGEPIPTRRFQVGDKVQAHNWHCSMLDSVAPTIYTVTKVTTITTFENNNHHRLLAVAPNGNSIEAAEYQFALAAPEPDDTPTKPYSPQQRAARGCINPEHEMLDSMRPKDMTPEQKDKYAAYERQWQTGL